MRVYVSSKAHLPRVRFHKICHEYHLPYFVVTDSDEQADQLKKHGVHNIIVAPTPPDLGMATQGWVRDFICREVAPKDEWMIWMDDNVEKITCLPKPHIYPDVIDFKSQILTVDGSDIPWRAAFEHKAEPRELDFLLKHTAAKADQEGTIFAGFATSMNYFFRARKWQQYGYVRTQFCLYKNDGSSWWPWKTMFEDGVKTVDVVARYGSVLLNHFCKPVKPHFEEGGIGTLEERIPALREECKMLVNKYPGLIDIAKEDYHFRFKKRSRKTVDQWRREHGYLQ